MTQENFELFQILDRYLLLFNSKVSIVKATRPINLNEEKIRFFENKWAINPQFSYVPLSIDLQKVKSRTKRLISQLDNDEVGTLYRDKLRENLSIIDLIELIGKDTSQFTEASVTLFGKPDESYLKSANSELNLYSKSEYKDEGRLLNAQEIAARIREAVINLGLDNVVEIINTSSMRTHQISIGKVTGKVRIAATCERTENDVDGVIAHEIGVHAVRKRNGEKLGYGIFAFGTANYLETEEGLALLKQYQVRINKTKWKSASTYLLMNLAFSEDFVSVYSRAMEYLKDSDKAWDYTVRVKRGIADTSQAGAFTKDQYFGWVQKLSELIDQDPHLENKLYLGKIHVDDLKLRYLENYIE